MWLAIAWNTYSSPCAAWYVHVERELVVRSPAWCERGSGSTHVARNDFTKGGISTPMLLSKALCISSCGGDIAQVQCTRC